MGQKIDIQSLKYVKNDEIKRGMFYWAAIPYTEERPLFIFEKIGKAKYTGKKKYENIKTFDGKFSSLRNKIESEEIDIIIRHKRRLVLVVQNDEYNSKEGYKFIYVIPITTHGKDKEKIEYAKNNDKIPHFHYIGQATNEESIANIGDIKRIHKNLLLETTTYDALSETLMTEICKKIGTLMEIGELEKCKECIYNYENYVHNFNEIVGGQDM
ncbi:type II toxin-antitoxin system PemK/MazF family toxin [Clostridium tagluense]|uniref:type II toxin-antitoxin system PemK/MazF family toxin n=1 Tax=Clostridium tagluense TaxID=360422 RepID=UPI001C6E2F66|nr:type II toxin-antitoxin system PemK/MazF family toxin [Clostridium tagluense]MBW9156287.1 type II toxin-antitoxin system PemK/MazF family toxin [Clostridium tagluense]WLC64297.1 type II toxin-antitoxin system PemK/MazF family toxin [Clostridium tagluense]